MTMPVNIPIPVVTKIFQFFILPRYFVINGHRNIVAPLIIGKRRTRAQQCGSYKRRYKEFSHNLDNTFFIKNNQRVAAYKGTHRRRDYRLKFHTPIYYITILTLTRQFPNFPVLERFFMDKAKAWQLRSPCKDFFARLVY